MYPKINALKKREVFVKIFKNLRFIFLFLIPFILGSVYIIYFESELFTIFIYYFNKGFSRLTQVNTNILGSLFQNASSNMQ